MAICVILAQTPIKIIKNPKAVIGKIIFLEISNGFIDYVFKTKKPYQKIRLFIC